MTSLLKDDRNLSAFINPFVPNDREWVNLFMTISRIASRRSHMKCSVKKAVVQNVAIFTGKSPRYTHG